MFVVSLWIWGFPSLGVFAGRRGRRVMWISSCGLFDEVRGRNHGAYPQVCCFGRVAGRHFSAWSHRALDGAADRKNPAARRFHTLECASGGCMKFLNAILFVANSFVYQRSRCDFYWYFEIGRRFAPAGKKAGLEDGGEWFCMKNYD